MMRRWLYTGLGALLAIGVAGGALFVATSGVLAKESPVASGRAPAPLQGGEGKGWLGLSLAQLNSDLASRLGISRTEGVVVMAVVAGSPAEAGGFQNKDVILSVGGSAVTSAREVVEKVRNAAAGSTVQFQVARGSQTLTLNVTIGQAPQPGPLQRGLGKLHAFGAGLRGRLPELEGIERPQLFDHFRGGQLNFNDRNGTPFSVRIVPGMVAAISGTSITVTPNGGGANVTFNIISNTRIHRLERGGATTPQVGDRVTVTAVGDEARAVLAWPAP